MAVTSSAKAIARRVTIRDVARASNASTAAVSRVLRNAYGVSDDMAQRVRAAMLELGYRPHAAARGMRGKTYTVGVVHPDLRNTFFPDLISSMASLVLPTDRQIFFATTEWSSAEDVLAAMHDRQIEGVVLIAPKISEAKLRSAADKLPIVLTHRHSFSSSYDTVVSDDDAGAFAVVEHLVELGHRAIVHVGPGDGKPAAVLSNVAARRARSYLKAMNDFGLGDLAEILHIDNYTTDLGYQVARELFGRSKRPTAIFAGADNVAFGVMQAAHEAGIRIPQDISLVGYDNTKTAALSPISLTSVDQNPVAMGYKAAELLLSRIEGRRSTERHTFRPTLVARRTTGSPPSTLR